MRGHLRKRVESRRKRISRRRRSHGKERIIIRRFVNIIAKRHRPLALANAMSDAVRPIAMLGGIRYSNMVYKDGVLKVWNLQSLSMLRGLSRYFTFKSIRTYKNSRSSYWFWSKKFFYWKLAGRARALKWQRRDFMEYGKRSKLENRLVQSYTNRRGVFSPQADEPEVSAVMQRSAESRFILNYIAGLKKGIFTVRFWRGIAGNRLVLTNVGKRFGKVSKNYRSKRNRVVANHYSQRLIKYTNSYSAVVAAKWARLSTLKLSSRFRLGLTIVDSGITLAPRMFAGTSYRAITMTAFFNENLGKTFTYLYAHRSYIDSIFNKNSVLLLKTFVLFFENASTAEVTDLISRVAEFKKLAIEKLKMEKKKNEPDYCYFTNAEVVWGAVRELKYKETASFDIISLLECSNAYTIAMCVEVRRLLSVLVFYSIKVH